MRNVSRFVLCSIVASSALMIGCGSGGDFPVAPVRGRVLCEGQPVPHVRVFFEPLETDRSAIVGKQAIAVTEADGTFVLSTYGTGDGAVIGRHRVRVGGPNRGDHPNFTCACVLNSEIDIMQVEVKANAENEFDVVLKKKTGRERPSLDEMDD